LLEGPFEIDDDWPTPPDVNPPPAAGRCDQQRMYSFGVEGSVDTEQGVVLVKPLRPPPGPAWSNRTGQPQVVETSPPKENLFEGSRRAIAFYWSPDSSKLLWLSVPEKDDFARTGEAFEVMLVATLQNHLLRSPPLSPSRFLPGGTWSKERFSSWSCNTSSSLHPTRLSPQRASLMMY
jgi:hypothetical protein